MPNFYFYALDDDVLDLLTKAVAGLELSFIPARNFSSEEPRTQATISELWPELRNGMFYATGPFTKEQVVTYEVTGGKYKGSFAINPQRCGPMIEVSIPKESVKQGVTQLSRGLVGHQAKFWSPDLSYSFGPPKALSDAYKEMTENLKSYLKRCKLSDGSISWLSIQAIELIESGRGLISSNGKLLGAG